MPKPAAGAHGPHPQPWPDGLAAVAAGRSVTLRAVSSVLTSPCVHGLERAAHWTRQSCSRSHGTNGRAAVESKASRVELFAVMAVPGGGGDCEFPARPCRYAQADTPSVNMLLADVI